MKQNTLSAPTRGTAPRVASTREARAQLARARSATRARGAGRTRSDAQSREHMAAVGLPFPLFVKMTVASFLFWSVVARVDSLRAPATYALAAVLAVAIFGLMMRQRAADGLTLLAYLAAVQPPLRLCAPALPYLALNYLLMGCALLLLFQGKRQLHFVLPILFYAFYIMLETIGMMNNETFAYGRTVLVPSATILVYLALAFKLRFSKQDIFKIFHGYILGTVGIAALILTRFQSASMITWGTESSSSASGGMGGNQITFLLAVGAFMCLLSADEMRIAGKMFFWALAGALSYFMILTFSRGGLYMLVAVTVLYYVFLKKPSVKTLGGLALFGVMGLLVFNATMATTGGKLLERYSETTLTNRDRIAAAGWHLFQDNMIFGVGTGNFYSKIEGVDGFGNVGAHNELIRAAAEHGIFGLASWVLFAITGLAYAARGTGAQDRDKRALRIAFFVFMLLSMFYNGLKLLVQPFLLLIALGAFTTEYDSLKIMQRLRHFRDRDMHINKINERRAARRRIRASADIHESEAATDGALAPAGSAI